MYHRKGLSINFLDILAFILCERKPWESWMLKQKWTDKNLGLEGSITYLISMYTSFVWSINCNSNNCAFRKWVAYTLLSVKIAQCLNVKLLLHHTGTKFQTYNCLGIMLQSAHMVLAFGSLFHVMYKIPEKLLLVMI